MALDHTETNLLDRAIAWFSPRRGRARAYDRAVLAQYEAAKPSRSRKLHRDAGTPNQIVSRSAKTLRDQARHLERNHDISRGALRVLVNCVVGPNGIGIEPQPRRQDGTIHTEYAKALLAAWKDWSRRPEVTWRMNWAKCQRTAARTWLRDGECFAQHLAGKVPKLDHGTRVPYSIELIEPDLVPLDYDDVAKDIRQGVEVNGWGRPRAYHVLKVNPADDLAGNSFLRYQAGDMRVIPASRMMHLAGCDRIGQLRGVSEFASVITRAEDIKDYEESERVAAKVAASLTAVIKKGQNQDWDPTGLEVDANGKPLPRDIRFQPGTIIDGLAPGESIDLIDTNRPNTNLLAFRNGQLRAFAAGIGASYSSASKDYVASYSAMRQEAVEQWVHYACLTDDFVGAIPRPTWEMFVALADLSGVVPRPADVPVENANDAVYIAQQMPWIDPLKEALGYRMMARAGFMSEPSIIRKLGGQNPEEVMAQIEKWRTAAADKGLVFDSDPGKTSGAGNAQPTRPDAPATGDDTSGDGEDSPPAPSPDDTVDAMARALSENTALVRALVQREIADASPASDELSAAAARLMNSIADDLAE